MEPPNHSTKIGQKIHVLKFGKHRRMYNRQKHTRCTYVSFISSWALRKSAKEMNKYQTLIRLYVLHPIRLEFTSKKGEIISFKALLFCRFFCESSKQYPTTIKRNHLKSLKDLALGYLNLQNHILYFLQINTINIINLCCD